MSFPVKNGGASHCPTCTARTFCLGFVVANLFAVLISAPLAAADWNQWLGPERTGYQEQSPPLLETLPEEGVKPLWVSEPLTAVQNGGWGSPVVAGNLVYLFAHKRELAGEAPGERKFPWLPPDKRIHLNDEEYKEYEKKRRDEDQEHAKAYEFREFVYAYDALTGEQKWVNQSDSTYTRFPQSGCPTVVDGKLYILGAGRMARCLNAQTGEKIWETQLPGEFRDEFYQASVLVFDQIAIFNATHLFGLNAETGQIVWTGDPEKTKGNHASPVLWQHDNQNYVIFNQPGDKTSCLDPQNGQVLWTIDSQAGQASPVVEGDKLLTYGNSRKKGLRCFQLTPEGANPLWVYQRITDKGSTPLVAQGHVYVQGERKLVCIDLETGSQLWMTNLDLESPQYTSPIAAGQTGIYAYDGIVAFKLTPEEFQPVMEAKLNNQQLLASTKYFRDLYKLDDNNLSAEERKNSMQEYQKNVGSQGPLRCTTPALSEGRLYLRLNNRIACYDLTQQ